MRKKSLRIIALSLTLILIFPLALLAANWQFNRHHERELLNKQLTNSYQKPPIQISSLEDFVPMKQQEYRRYKISGTLSKNITWWRKQSFDGIPGFIALTQFKATDDSIVVVALGWSQTTQDIKVPDLEQLEGRVRFIDSFEPDPSDLPLGQTNSPSTIIAEPDNYYFEITSPEFEQLVRLPLPEISSGPHLGYVGQWILIAIFAVCVYVIAIRNLPND